MEMSLCEAVRIALESLHGDAMHDLSLFNRGNVLTRLLLSHRSRYSKLGQCRLVKLEELSTRKVIPIWDSKFPNRREVHDLLEVARGFYSDNWDVTLAKNIRSQFPPDINEDLTCFVLEAAVSTLEVAIVLATDVDNYRWDHPVYPPGSENKDLDYPDGWDSAYCASVVFSQGVSWSADSDNKKRLEYWTWWLNCAVPEAYEAF